MAGKFGGISKKSSFEIFLLEIKSNDNCDKIDIICRQGLRKGKDILDSSFFVFLESSQSDLINDLV